VAELTADKGQRIEYGCNEDICCNVCYLDRD